MRVLLVHPPRFHMMRGNAPETIFRENYHIPISLLYVATYLKEKTNFDVRVFDYGPNYKNVKDIKDIILDFKPDIVGMTAYTFTLYDVYECCKFIKRIHPRAKIVLGGSQITAYPNETISQPFVDAIVQGEGEESFTELVKAYSDGNDFGGIRGVWYKDWYRDGGSYIANDSRPYIEDIDSIPFPDRNLVSDRYYTVINPAVKETIMISSRGCPYNCSYCYIGERKYRYRSPPNVVDEMERIRDMGYKHIHFFDDSFNIVKSRVEDICREIIRRRLKITWSFRAIPDIVDEQTVELLKGSGCSRIYFGVESGDNAILRAMSRPVTVEQITESFHLAHKYGIQTLGYFMIGFPYETEEQIERTIEFAIKLDPDYIQVVIVTPIPKTPLYFKAAQEGGLPGDYFREHSINPKPDAPFHLWETTLTVAQLIKLSKKFYRRFYFRPSYIAKRLREVRSFGEFTRKFSTAVGLLRFRI